jgi:phosphatidylglycerophosphate synthase
VGYTVLHVGVFFATGFIAAAIAGYAEDTPPLIIGAVMLFVAFEAFFMGLMALSAEFLLSTLAWWAVVVGNILATVTMGSYLWSRHPKLRDALARSPMDKTA